MRSSEFPVHVHDLSGMTLPEVLAESFAQRMVDGVHFGYYGERRLTEEQMSMLKADIKAILLRFDNDLHCIVGAEVRAPMVKNPPCDITDVLYSGCINPLMVKEFSDNAKIWGSRCVLDGDLFWYDSTTRHYSNAPPHNTIRHNNGIR